MYLKQKSPLHFQGGDLGVVENSMEINFSISQI